MATRSHPLIAKEGWPFVLLALLLAVVLYRQLGWVDAMPALLLAALGAIKFRDPRRRIPAAALGVVSPVDGRVAAVEEAFDDYLERPALCLRIRISPVSAYSVRSPVEGKVMEHREDGGTSSPAALRHKGLWLRTDEEDDVRLLLDGPAFARPIAWARYGERLGQGQRCGFLRLATEALLYLPAGSHVEVQPGARVLAGETVLASLNHAAD